MATLGELRDDLRDRKLVEASEDYFTPEFLLEMLVEASKELAASFRFPKRTEDFSSQASGTKTLTVSETPLDVYRVLFNGVSAHRAGRQTLKFYQALSNEPHPRVWFFDPMEGGSDVLVGPGNKNVGDFSVEYLGPVYQSTPSASTQAWNGQFEPFHELISIRATMKAFEMSYEYEKVSHYAQRQNMLMTEFARHLGMQVPQEGQPS